MTDVVNDIQLSGTPVKHLGMGNFARGHWLPIVQEMGLEVTGIQINTETVRKNLGHNGFDYHIIQKHPGREPEEQYIHCLKDIIYAPDERRRTVLELADPRTELVSMTVTAAGYAEITPEQIDRELSKDPNAGYRTIEKPKSAVAYIVAALQIRFEQGLQPFDILPLDNFANSGSEMKALLVKYAERINPEFATWMKKIVIPESMADRIVSSVDDDDMQRQMLEDYSRSHYSLPYPIVAEPMPKLCLVLGAIPEHPIFEKLKQVEGVLTGKDVDKYAMMKARLLNSTHMAIGFIGRTIGDFRYAHEVLANPALRKFVEDYVVQMEGTLPEFTGVSKREYAREIVERIANDQMYDPLWRISRNAYGKLSNLLLDPLSHCVSSKDELEHSALDTVAAAYIALLKKAAEAREQGVEFDIHDKAGVLKGITSYHPSTYDEFGLVTADAMINSIFGHFNYRQQLLDCLETGRTNFFELAQQVEQGLNPGPSMFDTTDPTVWTFAEAPHYLDDASESTLLDGDILDTPERTLFDGAGDTSGYAIARELPFTVIPPADGGAS